MSEYRGPERRAVPADVAASLAKLLDEVESLKSSQRDIGVRLAHIERSVNMVAGAWVFARYAVAVPAVLWGLYVWIKDHVR